MRLPEVRELIVREVDKIRSALETIDRTAQGIVFVVDERGELVGLATDGDVRRFLLKGGSLDEPVAEVMNTNFVSRSVGTSTDELMRLLSDERIKHIPLTDELGRPVDYACGHRLHRIQVMEPMLTGNELAYVTECIKTNWISSQGPFVRKFEEMFARYCGVPDAIAVSNGTVALHLALEALGLKEGDEVIVPDFTFAASINSILYTRATPVLVDVDAYTWTLDPWLTERAISRRTKAIMPVHIYGHPSHMDELLEVARKHGLYVIEDAAESLGSEYKGKVVGGFGDASAFSFFGNKTITTGEGGMLLLKDPVKAERARRLRDHGMSKQRRYWHEEIGYNYRMTNIQAAIGVAQMERVGEFVGKKRRLGEKYAQLLTDVPDIVPPPDASWAKNSYWLYTIMLSAESSLSRDELITKLLLNGIETRQTFYPLHEMPPYKEFASGKEFPVTESLSRYGISLPSAVTLSDGDVERVAEAISSIIRVHKLVNDKMII